MANATVVIVGWGGLRWYVIETSGSVCARLLQDFPLSWEPTRAHRPWSEHAPNEGHLGSQSWQGWSRTRSLTSLVSLGICQYENVLPSKIWEPLIRGGSYRVYNWRICVRSLQTEYWFHGLITGYTVVALTQISAYSTHKNPAVRKIMKAMRTAYAKKDNNDNKKQTGLGLNTSQTKHDANDHGTYASMWKESAHRLRTEHFILLNLKCAFELRHYYSFCWYAKKKRISASTPLSTFLLVDTHSRKFVRKFLVHLRTLYASPQKLARPLGIQFTYLCLQQVLLSGVPWARGRQKITSAARNVHNSDCRWSREINHLLNRIYIRGPVLTRVPSYKSMKKPSNWDCITESMAIFQWSHVC